MFEYDRSRFDELRPLLVREFQLDLATGGRYRSKRLTAVGWELLAELVLEACKNRDEGWLARRIEPYIVSNEQTSTGIRAVNAAASAQTIADGILNSLICRAECLDAIANGSKRVVAYRAGVRSVQRKESSALIGLVFDAATGLENLRADAKDPAGNRSSVPAGPNSGLSLKAVA